MFDQSSNPIFRTSAFEEVARGGELTFQGVLNRCFVLLALVVLFGVYGFMTTSIVPGGNGTGAILIWSLLAFVLAMVISFKPTVSPVLAPIYAATEGLFLGAVSKMFEMFYHGIVFQAVLLTFALMLAMLVLYRLNIIKVTDKFAMILCSAILGIVLFRLGMFVLSLFGVRMPSMLSYGPVAIALSVGVVIIASLSLLLDFERIRVVSLGGMPKYMGWYAAFGLMVTLVWLYLETLRLLSRIRDR